MPSGSRLVGMLPLRPGRGTHPSIPVLQGITREHYLKEVAERNGILQQLNEKAQEAATLAERLDK